MQGADAVLFEQMKGLGRLVDALALLDQRSGHVLDAQPQRAHARLSHGGQVLLKLERVMYRDLGAPTEPMASARVVRPRLGNRLNDVERPLFMVEEVVIGAEEIAHSVLTL